MSQLFPGESESARRMRAFDWAASPMGPPESWPRSLRALLPAMLESQFPMRVMWGPRLIFFHNVAFFALIGQAGRDALGQPSEVTFREIWETRRPLYERVLQGESIFFEDRLLPLDRHGFLEDAYLTLSYSPVRDDEGRIGGVLAVVHEGTARVLAERRLSVVRELATDEPRPADARAACAHAAGVLAKTPSDLPFALFFLHGAEGGLELVSRSGAVAEQAAALGGWPFARALETQGIVLLDDLRARSGGALLHEQQPIARAAIFALRRLGASAAAGVAVCGINPRLPFDESYRAFLELLAERLGQIASEALDRRERDELIAREQAARAEAERGSHAKDEFLSLVSHELRNPLQAMLGWTRLLRTGRLTPEKATHALETIERNAVKQSQLIEELLDVSRLTAGKLRLELREADLAESVRAALEAARPLFEQRQLSTQVALDGAAPVIGDPARLQQIAAQLLSNAARFTPPGGQVSASLRREGAEWVLVIADNGNGIAPEQLPLVFERFRLRDSSSTSTESGLGLGLSIAKSLVELHGGTIRALSEGLGRGSTFEVRLKAA